jgi:hypothetical protein
MKEERKEFLITQYIWALENEQVFVTKAQHEVERGHFFQFSTYVQYYTRDLRRELQDVPKAVEWAYLFTEMWSRMGGHAPNYAWHSKDADIYHQQKRRLAEHAATTLTNPCAEVSLGQYLQEVTQLCQAVDTLTSQPISQFETTKETPMSNKVIFKTVTFINNVDVNTLTEEQLIDAVKTIEREIADLKSVATQSKKIAAKIADAEATLAKVVKVLDAK